ncbi:MAG: UDP-3-O-(3-hydroxymyristoyl)glucosamine N-acyltransferase [Gemmatimonadota bacterium]
MQMQLLHVAAAVGGRLTDPSRDTVPVSGVKSLGSAGSGDLAFLWSDEYRDAAAASRAEAIVCREAIPGQTCIVVEDPEAAMLTLLGRVYADRHPTPEPGIHPTAVVAAEATLSEGVFVGPAAVVEPGASLGPRTQIRAGAYIGRGVQMGEDCVIHPNVTILDHCRIGDRVTIWSGAVIGKDGFGFLQREGRHVRIPQIGTVVIEDDVEIGALSNVARGAIDDTVIRRGVIVDDMCHIGHGSQLGEYTVMVGRSGMGGSVKIGKRCMLGQDSALSTGRSMGDGSSLATNVRILYKDVPAGETMQRPVITHPPMMAKRIEASLPHLPEMRRQMKRLEARLEAMEGRRE